MYTKALLSSLFILLCSQLSWGQDVHHPFIPNGGQWEDYIHYRADLSNSHILGTENGFRVIMEDPKNSDIRHEAKHGERLEGTLKYHAFEMHFLHARPSPAEYTQESPTLLSYFIGQDTSRWAAGLHPYASLKCADVWPGIDFEWKTEDQKLKYQWRIAPYADPENIQIQVKGADKVKRAYDKLYIETSVGDYMETKPYTYQIIDGKELEIKSQWYIKGDVISYDIMEEYDPSVELIIDPTLIFSTFAGSTSDNWGNSATYDSLGNFYLGSTTNGMSFPATVGAFQTSFGGGASFNQFPHDITISKFDPTGANLIYATYIGGSGDENPNSMIVDGADVILSGYSNSPNYPTTPGCIDPTHNGGFDIIITKLNSTGTALLGSTYIGGTGSDGLSINDTLQKYGTNYGLKFNYGDDNRSEVNIDNLGNIYLASSSRSPVFPFTYSTPATKSLQTALVLKANSNLSTLLWAGNYGGNGNDAAYVIDFDSTYNFVYTAGGTQSSNLSMTNGALQNNYAGGVDGFITRINTTTGMADKTTYLGTGSYDQIYGIQVDDSNNVYVTGQTLGTWPITAGVYANPNSAQFIQKMDKDLSATSFSTVYGDGSHSQTDISPVAFLVDECGAIFVSGWGGNSNGQNPLAGNTVGMPVSSNAIKTTTDGSDFHFIVLSRDAQSLLYATYFGQTGGVGEHVDGGTSRFNPEGQIYQAICANCQSQGVFPTTPGAYSTTNNSSNCNAAAVKIDFEYTTTTADAVANPDTAGCIPFVVNFTNQSLNASTNYWFFDDAGSSSTLTNPTHTYTTPGVYHPFLAVYNPTVCLERDTMYMTIIVTDDSLAGNFTLNQEDTCGRSDVSFSQNIVASSTSGLDASGFTYLWDFGNGNTSTLANPPTESYNNQGTYTVTLTVDHPNACNAPYVLSQTFTYADSNSLDLNISIPDSLCLPEVLSVTNNSLFVSTYYWDFGDGTTSTLANPRHTYQQAGIYTVTVVGNNSGTCNLTDTMTQDVYCSYQPEASFILDPYPNLYNAPLRCTNTSKNALSYLWSFGDGNTSTEENPTHLYDESGEYEVCLVTYNRQCVDTFCQLLSVTIEPLIDITTGFSPNGDLTNDFVEVNGFGIKKVDLAIYNRWGEKVYEYSGDFIQQQWDGMYKNTLQEADVYAYVLKADFTDGTQTEKKGNITLIK